jgi:hypothetical protein
LNCRYPSNIPNLITKTLSSSQIWNTLALTQNTFSLKLAIIVKKLMGSEIRKEMIIGPHLLN